MATTNAAILRIRDNRRTGSILAFFWLLLDGLVEVAEVRGLVPGIVLALFQPIQWQAEVKVLGKVCGDSLLFVEKFGHKIC